MFGEAQNKARQAYALPRFWFIKNVTDQEPAQNLLAAESGGNSPFIRGSKFGVGGRIGDRPARSPRRAGFG
jgi:hypothetical protein